eukprot:TRINITY_DN23517_c0_g2_i1.p2 TRINITY_DN23517_c0_g2~~TRINITY_DN23517_c0_g2_i1.p2  ORF type:complete len:286 (+),score=58.00 TRINITY_DN23517_c0_g2_i1:110-967(+)
MGFGAGQGSDAEGSIASAPPLPLYAPSAADRPDARPIGLFLLEQGLPQYEGALCGAGYEFAGDLVGVSRAELGALGLLAGHANRLLRAAGAQEGPPRALSGSSAPSPISPRGGALGTPLFRPALDGGSGAAGGSLGPAPSAPPPPPPVRAYFGGEWHDAEVVDTMPNGDYEVRWVADGTHSYVPRRDVTFPHPAGASAALAKCPPTPVDGPLLGPRPPPHPAQPPASAPSARHGTTGQQGGAPRSPRGCAAAEGVARRALQKEHVRGCKDITERLFQALFDSFER